MVSFGPSTEPMSDYSIYYVHLFLSLYILTYNLYRKLRVWQTFLVGFAWIIPRDTSIYQLLSDYSDIFFCDDNINGNENINEEGN